MLYAMSRLQRGPALLVAALLPGCDEPRAWDGVPGGGVVDESRPFLGAAPDASWLGDGAAPTTTSEVEDMRRVSPVGGLWVTCHGGFVATGEPERDLHRLTLMCGPVNGMSPHGDLLRGEVGGGEPAAFSFEARDGHCYRIFAVAEAAVVDLNVAVLGSRGSRVAGDHGRDRWLIVHPDRPFCSFGDEPFTVEVTSGEGKGRFVGQIWSLATSQASAR